MDWRAASALNNRTRVGPPLRFFERRPAAIRDTRARPDPHGRLSLTGKQGYEQTAGDYGCGLIAEDPVNDTIHPATSFHDEPTIRLEQELLRLARLDAGARRVLGLLANRFIHLRGFERLGFARLGDYCTERLGWSARQIQEVARVAAALARLPAIDLAFRSGAVGWSKARLLASLASPSNEARWLEVATTCDVKSLAAVTAAARSAAREQKSSGRSGFAPGMQSKGEAPADFPDDDIDEEAEDRVLVRIECSRRAMRLWNEARRMAPQIAGRPLAKWEVAELIAAEASSCPGPYLQTWQQEPWASLSDGAAGAGKRGNGSGRSRAGANPENNGSEGTRMDAGQTTRATIDPSASDPTAGTPFECELASVDTLDAFGLDDAMRRVRRSMQQRQSQLGAALATFLDLGLYRRLGFDCAADYIRERLGMSERSARDITRLARASGRGTPELTAAYTSGVLTPLQLLTLIPVLRVWNCAAWIRRAREVTLRRLADEVAWAEERALLEPTLTVVMPPAPDQDLGRPSGDRQICARHSTGDSACRELWGILGRIRLIFVAPISVSRLFRTIMQSFAGPAEPRWLALERMLEAVLTQWKSQPRHRDPVFARDGFRCTAPACSSHNNLHDHHVIPRSAGGTNDMWNRTTLCAWHHLRAVHGGLARAVGKAPGAIEWELGLATSRPPLLRLRGDRYLGTAS